MNAAEQEQDEEQIFTAARRIADPGTRGLYLQETCGTNDTLRNRLEALLASNDGPNFLLDRPVVATPDTGPDAEMSLDFLSPSDKAGSLGRIGHYEIQSVIGQGSMGVVLKAFDEKLQRVAAVKVMAPQLATCATARQRFIREARAAAAIRDDHVVNIHAVEEANGLPYLVMECISGISLQARLDRDGPLRISEVLRIGRQIAAGLAAAHAQGLIHRDIKPSNILLENGVERVKITDFGLARAIDDVSLTRSGSIAGTPEYMAPEQASGEAVDHRADLFSLGSVLYALCTGRVPFRANGMMAVLKRVCEDEPRPIKELNPEVPNWLVGVIAKLQSKSPADRYQTATEVAALLGQYLAHVQQPAQVSLPTSINMPHAPARRQGGRGWTAAAVVLLAGVAGLLAMEAAGVTKVRAAFNRIFAPESTVAVSTPEVQALAPLSYAEKRELTRLQTAEAERLLKLGDGSRTKDYAEAVTHFRKALALFEKLLQEDPNESNLPGKLAACRWGLSSALNLQVTALIRKVTLSDAETRRALALAGEAVALNPDEPGFQCNLSLIHYRAGNLDAALGVLEKFENIPLPKQKAYEVTGCRFLLAKIHWQRGDKDRARRCFDQAADWMDQNWRADPHLTSARNEAGKLLGVPP